MSESPSKLDRLRELKAAWRDCTACPLSRSRSQVIFADGPPDAKIVVVAEAPSYHEDKSPHGTPLIGPAGVMFGTWLEAAGLSRDDVHVTNACMCKAEDMRAPTQTEVAACRPRLMEQIRIVDPDLVITLGNTALGAILNTKKKTKVLSVRGTIMDVQVQGKAGKYHLPVLPMLSPAFVLKNPDPSPGGPLSASIDDMRTAAAVVAGLRRAWKKEKTK